MSDAPASKDDNLTRIGIVGSGATSTYALLNILKDIEKRRAVPGHLSIRLYEKGKEMGLSMPYDPAKVSKVHVVNIFPEEVPPLLDTFYDWMRNNAPFPNGCSDDTLKFYNIERDQIKTKGIYPRMLMGEFLRAQYEKIKSKLQGYGVTIEEAKNTTVTDIHDQTGKDGTLNHDTVSITQADGQKAEFDRVIIATGHVWPEHEHEQGYYRSPWPISKLDAEPDLNCTIGLLGSSLSAFDVTATLADKQGEFVRENGELVYKPHPGTENFHIVMHSRKGHLPHLRSAFQHPDLAMYRYVTLDQIDKLIEKDHGFLRLDRYFQEVCRPVLVDTLTMRDQLPDIAAQVAACQNFKEFFDVMDRHRMPVPDEDPFALMERERQASIVSIRDDKPIYWKEVLDELMYSLNFHAESMPAEDHMYLRREVGPALSNLVAFLPVESAEKLLALHKAGKVSVEAGNVKVHEDVHGKDGVRIEVTKGGSKTEKHYKMFVDCSGQKAATYDQFPFEGLKASGAVRPAMAKILTDTGLAEFQADPTKQIIKQGDDHFLLTGGIDIDTSYRLIDQKGHSNPRIYDISFPHAMGVRPFSPGLVYPSDIAEIAIEDLMEDLRSRKTSIPIGQRHAAAQGFTGRLAERPDVSSIFPAASPRDDSGHNRGNS